MRSDETQPRFVRKVSGVQPSGGTRERTCSSASMSPIRSPAVARPDPRGAPFAPLVEVAAPVALAAAVAAAAAADASPSTGRRRRRRRRGSVMNLGSGRASRSRATFVAACKACVHTEVESTVQRKRAKDPEDPTRSNAAKLTSIRSITPRSSLACRRNCSPSARTRTTCFRLM